MSARKSVVMILVLFFCMSFMAASANAAGPIVIKWGDAVQKSFSYWPAMEAFKAEVDKKAGGKVDLQLYGDGVLGDQKTLIESTIMGSVQMASTATLTIESFIPEHMAVGLPFIWPNRKVFIDYLHGDFYKQFSKFYEKKGLKLLAWSYLGELGVMNKKREIKSPEDLKGLKIRVLPTPLMIDIFKALGGTLVAMSHTEVYSALQQGVLDGISTGPQLLYTMKIQELAKYYSSLESLQLEEANVVVNLKFWNSLPPDIQKIFMEAAQTWDKVNAAYFLDNSKEPSNDKVRERFEQAGVKFTEPDSKSFREMTKTVVREYRNKIGPEIVDPVLKAAGYKLD